MVNPYDSGQESQLQIRKMGFSEGRAKGMQIFQVRNAAGLQFDVLADRCMGIGDLYADGERISFLSEVGPVHPSYYSSESDEWLRNFGGGFLVTCGLTQTGEPCCDEEETLGLHGRIDNIPAEQTGSRIFEEEGVLWGEMFGTVRQVKHQGENLELRRVIRVRSDEKKIWLRDCVTNRGSARQPYMILYHINFGFPFLQPGTKICMDAVRTENWNAAAERRKPLCREMPDIGEEPQDYLWEHKLMADGEGLCRAGVSGARHRVEIAFPAAELPILAQWQLAAKNSYVMALEPTNAHLHGRSWERQNGSLQYLQPGEKRQIAMQFSFGRED